MSPGRVHSTGTTQESGHDGDKDVELILKRGGRGKLRRQCFKFSLVKVFIGMCFIFESRSEDHLEKTTIYL